MGHKRNELQKTSTYIEGLDQVLNGGIPEGRTTVIEGGTGCGKSIIANEFIYRGALAKKAGIIINFEESEKTIRENCQTLGWDLAHLENKNLLFLHTPDIKQIIYAGGDFDLMGLQSIIDSQAKKMKAKRVVLEATDLLLKLFPDPAIQERVLFDLHRWLMEKQYTAILTIKTWNNNLLNNYNPESLNYLTDCLIFLDRRVANQITTRRLRVEKYRGSAFSSNEHPFVIDKNGLMLLPVSKTRFRDRGLGKHLNSGCKELDLVLGGGYRRYTCILVAGTTGAGKTSIAALFAKTRCSKKEKVLYISFEESEQEIVNNMKSVAINLETYITQDRLLFLTSMPESAGVEEHLIGAIKLIQSFNPQHIIVDAISACQRMGSEKAAFNFVIRLVSYCKENNLTTMLLNQTISIESLEELSGIDVSSAIDTIIRLSMVERSGEINRILTVMKARGSKHSNQFREFFLTDQGIKLKEIYIGSGTVLTGVERQIQEEQDLKELMNIKRKKQQVQANMQALQMELDNLDSDLKSRQYGLKKRAIMRK